MGVLVRPPICRGLGCSGACGQGQMSHVIFCGDLEGKVISNAQCNLATKSLDLHSCKDELFYPLGGSESGGEGCLTYPPLLAVAGVPWWWWCVCVQQEWGDDNRRSG